VSRLCFSVQSHRSLRRVRSRVLCLSAASSRIPLVILPFGSTRSDRSPNRTKDRWFLARSDRQSSKKKFEQIELFLRVHHGQGSGNLAPPSKRSDRHIKKRENKQRCHKPDPIGKFKKKGVDRTRLGTEGVCPLATADPVEGSYPARERSPRACVASLLATRLGLDRGHLRSPACWPSWAGPTARSLDDQASHRPWSLALAHQVCGRSRARSTTDSLCGQAPRLLPSFGSFCQFSSLVLTAILTDTTQYQ
jgi:hypothetical protein